METYIDRIKLMKAQRKITNEQLAERSGIPLGTLSKILAGMSDSPKLSTVVALCNVLECSVGYIVTGETENTNNYTLTDSEISLVEDYRTLDRYGRELVDSVLRIESDRCSENGRSSIEPAEEAPRTARILSAPAVARKYSQDAVRMQKKSIPLFELPVSAGTGLYLEEDEAETIRIPVNEKTAEADYVLRISGNSMEPKYHDGDLLLVQNAESVEVGELGIFLLDGNGYFKVYGGDCLISLNPKYNKIPLKDFSEIQCRGKVIGKLRKK